MKKIWLLLGMAVLLFGCAKQERQERPIQTEMPKEEVPDPMVEVEGAMAFAKVGADIEAPAGAEDAKYFIIADRVAEIRFTRNDVQYSYRASQMEGDLTGIEEEPQDLEGVKATVGNLEIPIQTAGSNYLALWKWGDITYSLIAREPADAAVMKSLAEELARDTMPAQL